MTLEGAGWHCVKCAAAKTNDPGAGYCATCGSQRTLPEPASNFCSVCGRPHTEGAAFCGDCGATRRGTVATPATRSEAGSDQQSPSRAESDPAPLKAVSSGGRRRLAILSGVGIAAVAAAVVGGGLLLTGGKDEAPQTPAGGLTSWTRNANREMSLLSRSVRATSASLTSTTSPQDLARVARSATQQAAIVGAVRARLAGMNVPAERRRALSTFQGAATYHRTYLATLARAAGTPNGGGAQYLGTAGAQGRRALAAYQSVSRLAPEVPDKVSGQGLVDTTGVQRAVRSALSQARATSRPATPRASSGSAGLASSKCPTSSACPVPSAAGAIDAGSTIDVYVDYCDRTPGRVNNFVYTFQLIGPTTATDTVTAAQSRACNRIRTSLFDNFPPGIYRFSITVENTTNGVSGTATTGAFEIH